jgi:cell division septation protein DedD
LTRFIRNLAGAIHSVVDEFDLEAHEGWEEITEEVAKAEHAHLFGEPDPAVEAVRAHDGAGNPVDYTSTGQPVTAAQPVVAEQPSTAPTGDPDPRVIEPTPAKKTGAHAAEAAEPSAEVTA